MKATLKILFFYILFISPIQSASIENYSTGFNGAKWGSYSINVCWENPNPRYQNQMDIVRNAIKETWEKYSYLSFTRWNKCSNNSDGIRIIIKDGHPHVKALGKYLNNVKNGMLLNFDFKRWSQNCSYNEKSRERCIYIIAVHEFGHALGFAHEQSRSPDARCRDQQQGTKGNLFLTPYDLHSVMNYCNPKWSGEGKLSKYDIKGLRIWYGSSIIPPHHISADGYKDLGVRFVDVDGDGLKDMIYNRYLSRTKRQVGAYKNTGKEWKKMSSAFNPPHHISADDHYDLGVRFVDVDGDGLKDMIYHRYLSKNKKQIGAYKNTGKGWKKMSGTFNPPHHISADDHKDLGVRFVDVDGDGLKDMIYHRYLSKNKKQIGAYKNTGKGWKKMSGTFNPPHHISADDHYDLGARFVDVDGDGLKDMIYHRYLSKNKKQIGAYKNTGKGWKKMSGTFNPPHHISADGHKDLGVRFVDVDGDGLEDMIYHRYLSKNKKQIGAYKNTGKGWKKMSGTFNPPHHISADGHYDLGVRFIDVNGDGLKDMIANRYITKNSLQTESFFNQGNGWVSGY